MWKTFRIRSAENIYQEILNRVNEFPSMKQFEICDPAFNQDLDVISRLCDLIINDGLTLRFSGLAQIRPEMTPELLKKMRRAGIILLNFGVESGSQKVLDSMGKRYRVAEAERVIKESHEAGIDVVLNFVVGFPNEEEKDFYETLDFIRRIKKYVSNIAPGHECSLEYTNPIALNPRRFNVDFSESATNRWRTSDNKVTFEERMHRVEIFNKFCYKLGIPLRCGADDRKERNEAGFDTISHLGNPNTTV